MGLLYRDISQSQPSLGYSALVSAVFLSQPSFGLSWFCVKCKTILDSESKSYCNVGGYLVLVVRLLCFEVALPPCIVLAPLPIP